MHRLSLTDIHTHILPSIDDGASDVTEALQILRMQKSSGVDRVVLTPHFDSQKQTLEDFLVKREFFFKLLMESYDEATMPELRLGAEVVYSPEILKLDLRQLTLCGGDYLLLELDDLVIPPHLDAIISELTMMGITPILAHVERCLYFRKAPKYLYELTLKGAIAQVTADSISPCYDKGFCKAVLNKGYAHFAASDTHNTKKRPPNLADSLKALSNELIDSMEASARCVWDNAPLYPFNYQKISKIFGKYY